MKIIIAGCGNVGYTLAEQLSEEHHDINVIDTMDESLNRVSTEQDVIGISGNCSSYRVQEEAGVEDADLMIAVTDRDEVNLLTCLIAKKAGNCQTIARVRNPEYFDEIGFLKEELGLSMVINPELAAATEIASLIQIPSAMEVDTFAKGRVQLVKLEVPADSPWKDLAISEIASRFGGSMLICIIERGEQVIIPNGRTVLCAGDRISVMVSPEQLGYLFDKMNVPHRKIRNVMIAGGGRITYYLAKQLLKSKIRVKIIEKKHAVCEQLSDELPGAMIIEGDASSSGILDEEGIKNMDAFIALTNMDEENIMMALYANKVSKAKRITRVNRIAFNGVLNDIPVGSIISPKHLTAEYIIQYVRSRQNSLGNNVEAVYRMMGNQVEALEFYVKKESEVTEKTLAELKLKKGLLVCTIVRNDRKIIPTGSDRICVGDSVIIVTTHIGLNDIREIME